MFIDFCVYFKKTLPTPRSWKYCVSHHLLLLTTFQVNVEQILWSLQNQYEKHKEVEAAQGVKILGKDLEKTLAGLPLLVAYKEDEIPVLKVSYLKFLFPPEL